MITKEDLEELKKKTLDELIERLTVLTTEEKIVWKKIIKVTINHYTTTYQNGQELMVEIIHDTKKDNYTIDVHGVYTFTNADTSKMETLIKLIEDSFQQAVYQAQEVNLKILRKHFEKEKNK